MIESRTSSNERGTDTLCQSLKVPGKLPKAASPGKMELAEAASIVVAASAAESIAAAEEEQ